MAASAIGTVGATVQFVADFFPAVVSDVVRLQSHAALLRPLSMVPVAPGSASNQAYHNQLLDCGILAVMTEIMKLELRLLQRLLPTLRPDGTSSVSSKD